MKEESLLLLSDLQKLINQVVLIDYTIIILGVNMGLGVENSVKSGRESDLSGLRKRYLGNFSI